MRYYLSFDGGGTKLLGILFDGQYRILACARASGVNPTLHGAQEIRQNIRQCVGQLLERSGCDIPAIQTAYASQDSCYQEIIEEFVPCKGVHICGEGVLGVLTCGLTSGICALSGTGSDVFYIRDGSQVDVLGGWGYALGDPGSGHDIGRKALELVVRQMEGVRSPSILDEVIIGNCGLDTKAKLMPFIYNQPSPIHYVASFCRSANLAAERGDAEAREILRAAGVTLARQAILLMKKHQLTREIPFCTTGSVLRHCALVRSAFEETLREQNPSAEIFYPIFEPVIGGLLYCMFQNGDAPGKTFYNALTQMCQSFQLI